MNFCDLPDDPELKAGGAVSLFSYFIALTMIICTTTTSKCQLAEEGKFEINGYFMKSISGRIQEKR